MVADLAESLTTNGELVQVEPADALAPKHAAFHH
jgi:hypothetical protein